ncbi:MAG: hypothetical protein ABI895_12650 [Deltaproteobacteria bacterium]
MLQNKKASFAAAVLLAHTSLAGIAAAAEDVKISTTTEEKVVTTKDEREETFWAPRKQEPARMAVAVNPIGLIFGLLLAEFDYGLSDTLSLNINAEYWNFSVTKAYGLGAGVQIFLPEVADSGPLYQGFYLYPSLQVLSVSVDSIFFTDDYSYVSVAPRFVAGWQWDWRPFTVRLGLGAEYYIASAKTGYDVDLRGLRFVGDGTLGLTF